MFFRPPGKTPVLERLGAFFRGPFGARLTLMWVPGNYLGGPVGPQNGHLCPLPPHMWVSSVHFDACFGVPIFLPKNMGLIFFKNTQFSYVIFFGTFFGTNCSQIRHRLRHILRHILRHQRSTPTVGKYLCSSVWEFRQVFSFLHLRISASIFSSDWNFRQVISFRLLRLFQCFKLKFRQMSPVWAPTVLKSGTEFGTFFGAFFGTEDLPPLSASIFVPRFGNFGKYFRSSMW